MRQLCSDIVGCVVGAGVLKSRNAAIFHVLAGVVALAGAALHVHAGVVVPVYLVRISS